MKNKHFKIFTIVFCFFISQMGWSQDVDPEKAKIDKTIEEFVKFFKNYDWTDYVEDEPKKTFACRGDAIPRLKRMRNPFRNVGKSEFATIAAGLEWFRFSIDSYVSGTNFDKVKEKEGSLFDTPTFKRDKMIEKLQAANGPLQFIEFYGTKLDQSTVKFTPEERKTLTKIYKEFSGYFNYIRWLIIDRYPIGDCFYHVSVALKPIKIESNRITWKFVTHVLLECDCIETSSTSKLRQLRVQMSTEMTSTWREYDYRTIRFVAAEKADMSIYLWSCCGLEHPMLDDLGGDDETKPDNSGDKEQEKKEEKEKDKLKRDKKCCDETSSDQSVGFFPTINFGNNLEDSTIGVGVEYLRKGGTSLENNNWYYGIGGVFATSSARGGELKEHFYSASAILENRMPIASCVQWTQRVGVEYGQGTLEAFGVKDDFTHFGVNLNTGFNVSLSPKWSVAVDANLFQIGSQTFKPSAGPEIKTDITNLSLPPTEVRFGFRLNF